MRVTDEGRKKTAAELREYAESRGIVAARTVKSATMTGEGITQATVLGMLVLLSTENLRCGGESILDLMGFLADCIEPKEERTCRNVGEDGDDFFYFTCSECGASVTHDELGICPVERYTEEGVVPLDLNYCPHCGAKVVGE